MIILAIVKNVVVILEGKGRDNFNQLRGNKLTLST